MAADAVFYCLEIDMTSTAFDDQFAVCTPEAQQKGRTSESAISSQRELFEAWAKSKNFPIAESKITGVGVTYKYATTESAWQAWQAACPEGLEAVDAKAMREALDHWAEYEPSICAAPEYTDILMVLYPAPKPEAR